LTRTTGAAVVLASHDPQDLGGICDLYLFLVNIREGRAEGGVN
jgi:hypothetical protein